MKKFLKSIMALSLAAVSLFSITACTDDYSEQLSLFYDYEYRQKQMKVDRAVDIIRSRFGYYSIQRGLMYYDKALSNLNPKEEHTVHPHSYF